MREYIVNLASGKTAGELTRCKDCKYWPYKEIEYYSDSPKQKTYQRCFDMIGTDYCSRAEKETTEE